MRGQVTKVTCLQAGAVDDLHVDSKLTTIVVEDNDTDGTAARLESLIETSPEVGLVNDWDRLLDITLVYVSIVYVYCLLWGVTYGLGHGNDSSISKVQDAILLEDRAEHGLHGDRWGWARDEGGILVELLGEQVNTEEAVLAGGLVESVAEGVVVSCEGC